MKSLSFFVLTLVLSNLAYARGTELSTTLELSQCTPTIEDQIPLDAAKADMLEDISDTLSASPNAPFTLNIKPSSTKLEWKKEYTDSLYKTFSGPTMESLLAQKIDNEDLKKVGCPNFNELDKEDKKKFYIVYLSAIAEAGSDYDPSNKTKEKDGTTDYGLLQIDKKSAERHAGKYIGKPINNEQLKNYHTNLEAGAYILRNQITGKIATGRLFPDKTYYWPTLKDKQKDILSTMQSNSESTAYCKSSIDKVENSFGFLKSAEKPPFPYFLKPTVESPEEPIAKEKDLEIIPAPTKVIFPGDEAPLRSIAAEEAPLKALAVDEETLEVIPRAIRLTKETKQPTPVSKAEMPKSDWSWFSSGYKKENKEVFLSPKKEIFGNYVNKSINISSLNEKEFSARVNGLTTIPTLKGNQYCAKGVRQSLNALFGYHSSFGEEEPARNAKDYNENKLREWRKGNLCFKEEPENGQPKNYDVHVYGPSNDNQYGHIEIFYNGVWTSDHQQAGTSWNNSNYPNRSQSLYRLSECSK